MHFKTVVIIGVGLLPIVTGFKKSPPKYTLKFHDTNISPQVAEEYIQSQSQVGGGSFQMMKAGLANDRDYLCYVPETVQVNSSIQEDIDLEGTKKTPDGVLLDVALDLISKSLSTSQCVFNFGSNGDYWTYAYCFGDKVIQFHENMEYFIKHKVHKPEFPNFVYVLGQFPSKKKLTQVKIENQSTWSNNTLDRLEFTIGEDVVNPLSGGMYNIRNSPQKYVKHTLKDGELCDYTRKPRTVDVIYRCDLRNNGHVKVYDVTEITTCEYQLVVNIPRLCQLEEFKPKNVQDEILEIGCKEIVKERRHNTYIPDKYSVDDFLTSRDVVSLPPNQFFPISKSSKISLAEHSMISMGNGFYFAIYEGSERVTESFYYNGRHPIIYNGFHGLDKELIFQIGQTISNGIGRTLISPKVDEQGRNLLLWWSDTFIFWFELYDYNGNFLTMVKIHRDGTDENEKLYIQLVDPETMLDTDGDLVTIDEESYKRGGTINFEMFVSGSTKILTDDSVEEKTEVKNDIKDDEDETEVEKEVELKTHTVTETETIHGEQITETRTVQGDPVVETIIVEREPVETDVQFVDPVTDGNNIEIDFTPVSLEASTETKIIERDPVTETKIVEREAITETVFVEKVATETKIIERDTVTETKIIERDPVIETKIIEKDPITQTVIIEQVPVTEIKTLDAITETVTIKEVTHDEL